MENQQLLNILISVSLAVLGWFARQLWEATQNLKNDLKKIEVELPTNYVTKIDIQSRFDKLEAKLDTLFERIDRKVDK
jgi:chaperonin cofactor prefoldin